MVLRRAAAIPCALASKTVTASLPAALLLAIWWKHGRVMRGDVARLAPFMVCGVGFGLHTLWLEVEHVGAVGAEWEWSPVERMLIAGRAIWFYMAKLVLPIRLTFVYPRWEIDPRQIWQYVYPFGVAALLIALWAASQRLGRGPLAATLFFIGTLVPALSLFNVYPLRYSFVADHFQYLASLGVIALVVAAAGELAHRQPCARQSAIIAAGVAVLLTFAALTWQRTYAFRDAETLWRDTLAKNPAAWIAQQNLGVIELKRGDLESAERGFNRVLELKPGDARANNNLASLALARGDVARAIGHLESALVAEPDYVGARLNLCKILLSQGRVPEASEHYLHALGVDPDVATVQSELGLLLLARADASMSARFFDRAIKFAPRWTMLINERAWRLATAQDLPAADLAEALRLAQRAAKMTDNQDPNVLDTLAAAYAATGQFDEAVTTAKMALELVTNPDLPLAEQIRHRMALYGERNPYREEAPRRSK